MYLSCAFNKACVEKSRNLYVCTSVLEKIEPTGFLYDVVYTKGVTDPIHRGWYFRRNDTKHTRRFAPRRTRDGDRWQHLRIPRLQPPPHGKVSSDAQTAPQSDPIVATAAEASSSGAESVAQVATRSDSAVATTAVGSGSGAELDTQTAAQPDPAVVTPAVGSSNGAEVGTRNVTQDDTIASTAPASPNT